MQFLLLNISALVFGLSALAGPDCNRLKDAWDRRFSQEFETPWNGQSFTCNGRQYLLAQALYDLNREYVAGNTDGTTAQLFSKVKASTKKFRVPTPEEIKNADCKQVVAFHSSGESTLCPPFFRSSREERAATILHEARHGWSDDSGHVGCVSGPNKKTKSYNFEACDQKFYDGDWQGSGFNAEVYFYSWNIHKRTQLNNLSDAILRSELRKMIPDNFVEITAEEIKKWRK